MLDAFIWLVLIAGTAYVVWKYFTNDTNLPAF